MKNLLIGATAALALLAAPAMAKDTLKIGMVVTLSGPPGALGNQARDGFMLAMDKLDGKIGGMDTEFILEDDELKADVAQSKAKSLVEKEEVDFVVGTIFSNMLAAIYKPVIKSDTFLISPNAGPSTFAGKNCNPNFFVTSYQNNQNFEVLGKIATDKEYKKVFMLAPNYQAGKDSMAGFKQNYKGEIADEVFTPLGHKDFSAEIARISESGADALFIFMPGGMGVRFVKQFRASGLADKMAFLSAFTVDETTLPGQKDDAVGMNGATNWAPDLENDQTAAFVEAFEKEYGYIPGGYAMQAYDTAMLIDSAVTKAGGVDDRDAVREALKAADFESLRGDFSFNNNHYPVQDFYLLEVVKRDDGKFHTSIVEKVYDDYSDSYADQCKM